VEPTGTVVLLFTDIEGSTRLWETDAAAMSVMLARHDALLRQAIEDQGGRVFKTVGDAFCAAFDRASDALAAALDAQRSIQGSPSHATETAVDRADDFAQGRAESNLPPVRMVLHAGAVEARGGDYFGRALNRAARLLAIGHGGQILLSRSMFDLAAEDLPADIALRDLGFHRLKDLDEPEQVYQVVAPALRADFPPLRSLNAERHNLPLQLTSFIGRQRELAELGRRLAATCARARSGSSPCSRRDGTPPRARAPGRSMPPGSSPVGRETIPGRGRSWRRASPCAAS
jgi:class 3 adenylate cyclase